MHNFFIAVRLAKNQVMSHDARKRLCTLGLGFRPSIGEDVSAWLLRHTRACEYCTGGRQSKPFVCQATLLVMIHEVMLKQHHMVPVKVTQHLDDLSPAQVCDVHHIGDELLIQSQGQVF